MATSPTVAAAVMATTNNSTITDSTTTMVASTTTMQALTTTMEASATTMEASATTMEASATTMANPTTGAEAQTISATVSRTKHGESEHTKPIIPGGQQNTRCECEYSLTFRDRYGKVHGACRRTDNTGKTW